MTILVCYPNISVDCNEGFSTIITSLNRMAVTLMEPTNQLEPAPRHGPDVQPLPTHVQSVPHNHNQ